MADEIERKFLLGAAPDWLAECPAVEIEQGYLTIAERSEVRLRRADGKLTLTAKRGHGEVRGEAEVEIGADQFEPLWELTEGRRLAKTRHLVELGDGLTAEVDVYAGSLAGLVTAEVEFESEESSRAFRAPDWMGRELTGDGRYANQSLAALGRPLYDPAGRGRNS